MADMKAALAAYGAPPGQIHIEIFNGGEAMSPGVVRAAVRNPHMSPNDVDTGWLVSFARSGIAAHWNRAVYQSILEISGSLRCPGPLVVPGRRLSQLRSGVVSGAVAYGPEPLDKPAEGNILVCCSQSVRDVVIDL
jgi:hypothetical protein